MYIYNWQKIAMLCDKYNQPFLMEIWQIVDKTNASR